MIGISTPTASDNVEFERQILPGYQYVAAELGSEFLSNLGRRDAVLPIGEGDWILPNFSLTRRTSPSSSLFYPAPLENSPLSLHHPRSFYQ
jgi:hypothetical protein